MSAKVRSASQKFKYLCRTRKFALVQPIRITGNWLVRGTLRKCLACGGIPNFSLTTLKTDNGFKDKSIPYTHTENCTNKF